MAEKEGFEPSLRFCHTTPLAGEPLRPLGYFSVLLYIIIFLRLGQLFLIGFVLLFIYFLKKFSARKSIRLPRRLSFLLKLFLVAVIVAASAALAAAGYLDGIKTTVSALNVVRTSANVASDFIVTLKHYDMPPSFSDFPHRTRILGFTDALNALRLLLSPLIGF